MQLTSIHINLLTYGPMEGKYEGSVNFKNMYGAIEIKLSDKLSQEVLKLCADALVEQAKETGKMLTANILEQVGVPQLPDND